jgi:hypothetical protein
MDRHSGARWFYGLPSWIRTFVYDLTGWQVQKMTIRRNRDAGLFGYTTETTTYSWSKSRKIEKKEETSKNE